MRAAELGQDYLEESACAMHAVGSRGVHVRRVWIYNITRGTVRGPAPLQAPCVTNERHSVGSLELHTYYPNSKPSTHWKGVGGPALATPTACGRKRFGHFTRGSSQC